MGLKIYSDKERLVSIIKDTDGGESEMIFPEKLGSTIDKSNFPLFEGISNIIQISIPENVEFIEPGTFTDFTGLTSVEIRGIVYGVIWHGGTDGRWTAPLSPATIVEEFKKGSGFIEIIRK